EFIAVYGRRRVGKTFLVRTLFEKDFAFHVTAVLGLDTQAHLSNFASALSEYGGREEDAPENWPSAFRRLRALLENANRKRKVVFIDEMPWLDTKGSGFVPALENFWNGWASAREDICLIICGSAASWIVKKLFQNRGGLHNRVTRRILLQPFSLAECRRYFMQEGLPADETNLLEAYMCVGGIPYYLSLLRAGNSLAQNISRLCFSPGGALREEFGNLYASLFQNADRHIAVVYALGKKSKGLTREEIKKATGLPEGGNFSAILSELEMSGFIRKYTPFSKKKKGSLYQLTDHYTLFYLAFIRGSQDNDDAFWQKTRETQRFRTWRGYAFEQVCLSHIDQIRRAVGVSGVITCIASWRSEESKPGAQIDLLIDRNDGAVTLCEMKYSDSDIAITKSLAANLRNKRNAFAGETGTTKAVQIAIVTPIGVKRSAYYDVAQTVVTMEDLTRD
ncbi:MAG: ATP-binding protein, partial [Clostridiales Family XIII bacterium]|nr:ATP-binding protein [Clostridiales Family XIII bacterium]